MLVIRQAQIQAFDEAVWRGFCERTVDFLLRMDKKASPARRPEMLAFVERQLGRAKECGFHTERQLVTFALAAWLMGETFDRNEFWGIDIRNAPGTPEQKRLYLNRCCDRLLAGV